MTDGWQVLPQVPADAILDFYRRQIELANAIITAAAPGAAPSNALRTDGPTGGSTIYGRPSCT
jgi:hypothetical protein